MEVRNIADNVAITSKHDKGGSGNFSILEDKVSWNSHLLTKWAVGKSTRRVIRIPGILILENGLVQRSTPRFHKR